MIVIYEKSLGGVWFMQTQTYARLAKDENEYNALCQQTSMLMSQQNSSQAQVAQLQQALSVNSQDKGLRQQYALAASNLRAITSSIHRNRLKLANLERQMANERNKIANSEMRAQAQMMKRACGAGRRRYY